MVAEAWCILLVPECVCGSVKCLMVYFFTFSGIGVHMALCTGGIYALCLSFSHDYDYSSKFDSAVVVHADVRYELFREKPVLCIRAY